MSDIHNRVKDCGVDLLYRRSILYDFESLERTIETRNVIIYCWMDDIIYPR